MVIKTKCQIIALAAAALIMLTNTAVAEWGQSGMFYPGGHMMSGGYMGWTMIFFWVLLLAVLILVIRYVVHLTRVKDTEPELTPLDILKKRLARGEIDIEEFQEKKKFL